MTISINLENSRPTSFSNEQQTRNSPNAAGGSQRPQSTDAALDTLVKSMTDSKGQVNSENPLVKLLTQLMEKLGSQSQAAGGQGSSGMSDQKPAAGSVKDMSPDDLLKLLSQLLGGSTGGAGSAGSAGAGNGFGGGNGGVGGGGGAGGGGDALSSLLGGLAEQKLGSLLEPAKDGSGGATFNEGDKALLQEVANFMDQHSDKFEKPQDADGNTKSWSDELNEKGKNGEPDTFLDGAEASKFKDAIAMIGQAAGSGTAPASGMLANSGIPISPDQGSGSGSGGGGFGGGGGGGSVGGSGGFGGGNGTVTMGLDDLLKLLQGQGQDGNTTQGSGPKAQDQALQQDAQNTAGSIMNKLFS
ncbi:harpin HrpZ family protein [Pseudomonas quasicaspiana]|uniref:harpin HrpZ family protein n=1 Tax=Pseudomonas quasicaspiana TaxID=2829821 RepID=UPI001E2F1351|nr:harpin HrpZ family protein [Pseudomonas quasicaspiana]MCD5973734.1 hypothetical protein [Pseudomonas quasicaspiana]